MDQHILKEADPIPGQIEAARHITQSSVDARDHRPPALLGGKPPLRRLLDPGVDALAVDRQVDGGKETQNVLAVVLGRKVPARLIAALGNVRVFDAGGEIRRVALGGRIAEPLGAHDQSIGLDELRPSSQGLRPELCGIEVRFYGCRNREGRDRSALRSVAEGVEPSRQRTAAGRDFEEARVVAGDLSLDLDHALADADAGCIAGASKLLVVGEGRPIGFDLTLLGGEEGELVGEAAYLGHDLQAAGLDPRLGGRGARQGRLLLQRKFAEPREALRQTDRRQLRADTGLRRQHPGGERDNRIRQGLLLQRPLRRRLRLGRDCRHLRVALENLLEEQVKLGVVDRCGNHRTR